MKYKSTLIALVATAGWIQMTATAADNRPNIIFILTDDWGRADLSQFGTLSDIKTPHIDKLALAGIRFTAGYVTAPQCAPSRAGLLTGRYQQRYGFDDINTGPLPLGEVTLADRLSKAGYATGMVGKWHLDPNYATLRWAEENHPELVTGRKISRLPFETIEPYLPGNRGFQEFYLGNRSPYYASFDLGGVELPAPGQWQRTAQFRVDVHTEAALAFIRKSGSKPFFLYLAYYAPHVPLEATQKYLKRFPGRMPERRRYALAMMAAVDDGVGRIVDLLDKNGLKNRTLIVFLSDNGAPLGVDQGALMEDVLPVDTGGSVWDGSRNDPFRGEKGMLSEGGIRVPFLMAWPGTLPAGVDFSEPVISLDLTATANAAAGLPDDPVMDGVNLLPCLTGRETGAIHEYIYWKFWNQAAIRSAEWKFIQFGKEDRMLFNLREDKEERRNLIGAHPQKAKELALKLSAWAALMKPPGLPARGGNESEEKWYHHYFDAPWNNN